MLKTNELNELKDAGKISEMLSQCTEIRNSMPDLLWLFRNSNSTFKLTDPETKQAISATQYLENSLLKINPETSSVLFTLFPNRHAITLPKPSSNDLDISNQHFDKFSPAFKNAFDLVKQEISSTKQKLINGVKLTGILLLTMADQLCLYLSSNQNLQELSGLTNVYSKMCDVNLSRAETTIIEQTRKFIGLKCDKRKSLSHQTLFLPEFIVSYLNETLFETPSLESVQSFLHTSAINVQECEKQQMVKFFTGLAKDCESKSIYDLFAAIVAFYNYYGDSNVTVVDFLAKVKEKSVFMQQQKWLKLQDEINVKDLLIESKQKEFIDLKTNFEELELKIKISAEDHQELQSLIERLKIELGLLSTELFSKENDLNQIKIELSTTNESLEQYMMVIAELKTKWESKNEDKLKLEQFVTKERQLLKEMDELQQVTKKQQMEIESKKVTIDEMQEKAVQTARDNNKKIELLHIDIVNEKAKNIREEERASKRLKTYQDAAAQQIVNNNELQSLKQQRLVDASKIAELQSGLVAAKRMQSFHELLKNL